MNTKWLAVGTAMRMRHKGNNAPMTAEQAEGCLYLIGAIVLVCIVIRVWKKIKKWR